MSPLHCNAECRSRNTGYAVINALVMVANSILTFLIFVEALNDSILCKFPVIQNEKCILFWSVLVTSLRPVTISFIRLSNTM